MPSGATRLVLLFFPAGGSLRPPPPLEPWPEGTMAVGHGGRGQVRTLVPQGTAVMLLRIGSLEHPRKLMANILAVAGPGSKYQLSGARPAGFWAGLWHGIISPITFIVSLFNLRVRIYETHNRVRLYDFGFILGISSAFGGSVFKV